MKVVAVFLVAFGICVVAGTALLPVLRKVRQPILHYVREHEKKAGTPTMGGWMFLISITAAYLIFREDGGRPALLALCIAVGYGLVGFLDDMIKIRSGNNEGLRPWQKIIFQVAIAAIAARFVLENGTELILPFTGTSIAVGWWSVPLTMAVFLAVTNGVNLTDGLDGLCAGSMFVYSAVFCALLLIRGACFDEAGRMTVSGDFLNLGYLSAAVSGSMLGFLLFNAYPAKVFMGDTGSLLLGGYAASVACFSEFTLFLPFFGIVFVISCVSDVIQVLHYNRTRRRVFKMAPFHHHLQQSGLSETRIGWIYMALTAVFSLAVLMGTFYSGGLSWIQ